MNKRFFLYLGLVVAVGACSALPKIEDAQYWQRINASEATYINGPKAQQILNRDIARCVTDLKELERLGQLRNTIPTGARGRVLNEDERTLAGHDTPERDGDLLAEHFDYHDFDSCMTSNGWERTTSVAFDAAERAEDVYKANHLGYQYRSKFERERESERAAEDFND